VKRERRAVERDDAAEPLAGVGDGENSGGSHKGLLTVEVGGWRLEVSGWRLGVEGMSEGGYGGSKGDGGGFRRMAGRRRWVEIGVLDYNRLR
jgi:hypothetical protein